MTGQAPAIMVTIPLLSALLIVLFSWVRRSLCYPLALAGLSAALASSVVLASRVALEGPVLYRLGGWSPPWGIAYYTDYLNAPILPVIAFCALMNLVASFKAVEKEQKEKAPVFYALYVLAVTGLLGIVVTGDAFNLYVLLEISSLAGYALIASGDNRAPLACLNYLFIGTLGASFYLLGVGFLYMVTGSLNMADLAGLLPGLYHSRTVKAAFILIMVGVWLKAAFFPMHAWLPGAYTHASSPASSLVAPLMTKVMIYVMIRMMLTVFTPSFVFSWVAMKTLIVWLASIAVAAGAIMALAEKNLKKMAAYIIIAEVGYMVGGAWLGNRAGMTGAILHIMNDALMTLVIFMAIGNVVYKTGGYAFGNMKRLFARMPFTMGALAVAAISIIGVPPACGFFSKWYLLLGAIQAGHYEFAAALIFSSLAGVVLFFRVFELAYFSPDGASGHHHAGHARLPGAAEAPLDMVAPLLIAAAMLLVAGLYTGFTVSTFTGQSILNLLP